MARKTKQEIIDRLMQELDAKSEAILVLCKELDRVNADLTAAKIIIDGLRAEVRVFEAYKRATNAVNRLREKGL